MDLLYINWNPSPEIISIGPISLRWYGLLFALGFLLGLYIVKRMFEEEKAPEKWLDSAFIYIVVGAVLGARLGHVFFYDWDYYSQHLSEIPKVWHGGLASHGGALGIFVAIFIYSRVVTKKSMLWLMDKIAAPAALAGLFIRTGNLMNSEIIGRPTDVSWAFVFEKVDQIPRHPVQIYEALFYFLSFIIIYYAYWKLEMRKKQGFSFGLFMVLVWGGRFIMEFFKDRKHVEGMAEHMQASISTGQMLSVPFILIGLYFMFRKGGRAIV